MFRCNTESANLRFNSLLCSIGSAILIFSSFWRRWSLSRRAEGCQSCPQRQHRWWKRRGSHWCSCSRRMIRHRTWMPWSSRCSCHHLESRMTGIELWRHRLQLKKCDHWTWESKSRFKLQKLYPNYRWLSRSWTVLSIWRTTKTWFLAPIQNFKWFTLPAAHLEIPFDVWHCPAAVQWKYCWEPMVNGMLHFLPFAAGESANDETQLIELFFSQPHEIWLTDRSGIGEVIVPIL